jgi:hypothetical protein
MNDLKSFVVLQARLFEFLAQQDNTTLHALASGTAQLTVLPADGVQTPREDAYTASADVDMTPPRDPLQAAQTLSRLSSEDDRRIYLNASKLRMTGLKDVAKLHGLTGYSRLTHRALIDLLASRDTNQIDTLKAEPRPPAPATPDPVDDTPAAEQHPTARETPPSTSTAQPNADAAAIASRLREMETEQEGAAYLHEQHLGKETLLAVAAELQLTRVERLNPKELEKRVLKQAIGARRKFAGLRKW